jgi:chromodomain-helicase-DNA-binding protein 4
MEDVEVPPVNDDQDDSWVQTLRRIADEQAIAEAMEITGRGVRRKAAIAANPQVPQVCFTSQTFVEER